MGADIYYMRDFKIAANVPEILGQMFDGFSLASVKRPPEQGPAASNVPHG